MTIGIEVQLMCKLSFYFVTLMMQIYLICDYGQQLLDASVSISKAAYNHAWFSSDIRYKRMLIIMASRADSPVTLQATALVAIRMTTLTTVRIQLSSELCCVRIQRLKACSPVYLVCLLYWAKYFLQSIA